MIAAADRRSFKREKLTLPLSIDNAAAGPNIAARMLDASQAGVLLELPALPDLRAGQSINLCLACGSTCKYDLGAGIIRHAAVSDGRQLLGIELRRESPFLFGAAMLGTTPRILEIKDLLSRLDFSGLNILIRGETGTDKNVLAQLIHELCRGKQQPFIRVNCPSLPETLFESELFGHEKGAYTDAKTAAPGFFRLAAEGTILLDEISEIRPHLQAKLLRVLEDKEFMPVGGRKLVPVRANIIATTNLDLEKAVDEGRFRRDLFFRLCELPIQLPPLRERTGDIAMLAHYFLLSYCDRFRRPPRPLAAAEIGALEKHDWPGNIRELENYMKQTALLGKFVGPGGGDRVPPPPGENLSGMLDLSGCLRENRLPLPELTRALTTQIERHLIARALDECRGNRTHAARLLGISYRTLLRKLEQHRFLVSPAD